MFLCYRPKSFFWNYSLKKWVEIAGKEPIKLILKDGFEEYRPKFLVNDNVYNEIVQNNSKY